MTRIDPSDPPRWVRRSLVLAAVVPIAVAVARAMLDDWFPIGDSALLYIRARDVLTAHHPFLGSWTSASLSVGEHMNNPGPLYPDLLLPWTRIFGFSSAAALAVGVVNALTVVGIVAAGRTIGGWRAARWALLAAVALAWVMGSELLIDIWQAHALLLPFLALLLLAVGLAVGRWSLLPWAAAAATLLVQTHISYVYAIGAIAVTTAAIVVLARRWDGLGRRHVLLTAATLAVLWAQSLWEQLFGPGKGNLSRLAGNASGGDLQMGLADGTRFAGEILVRPLWSLRSGFGSIIPPLTLTDTADGPAIIVTGIVGTAGAALLLVALLVVLVGLGWAHQRGGRDVTAAACWVMAGTVAATPVCLSLVTVGTVGLAQHHLRWTWAVGVLANVVVLWALLDLGRGRVVAVVPVVLALVLAVLTVPYHAQPQGPVADYEAMPALRRVFRDLDRLEPYEPVVYDAANVRVFEPYSSTVMMRLQELGIDVRVTDEGLVRQLGERRRASGSETTTVFQLERADALTYEGRACLVSMASALDPAEEEEADEVVDDLVAALAAGTSVRVDPGVAPDDEAALRRAILDGTFAQWVASGAVSGEVPSLTTVERRVDSTYAVFADVPGARCP